MAQSPIPLKDPARAALLAWLVPGLGHVYQGRTGKGILYGVCIIGLYAIGMALGEGKVVYWSWISPTEDSERFFRQLPFLCQFWVGLPGVFALFQATLKHYGIDPVLWGALAEPPINVMRTDLSQLGRYFEIAWLYTSVAGLLNILAIFDAYEGPALGDEPASPAPAPATAEKLDPVRAEGRA